jgi:phosphate transport system substrate-binding protein
MGDLWIIPVLICKIFNDFYVFSLFSDIIHSMRRLLIILGGIMLILLVGCTRNGATQSQQASSSISATSTSAYIQNAGSDTIVNLALAWAERYQKVKPGVSISVTGGGSGTGLSSLLNKTTDIANASRQISAEELTTAKKEGLNPQEFVIARDAIAVVVNPENPVDNLTIEQLSKIYRGEINNWQEVGGDDRPIVRLSRETNSGTHVYFLDAVIRLGDSNDKTIFSRDTLLLPSSEGIIAEVRDNPNAIGYDGLGYVTSEVKMVAISGLKTPDVYVLPSAKTVSDNSYVISRNLYMYTQNPPTGAIKEYLDWILSADAQQIVIDLGFVPVK